MQVKRFFIYACLYRAGIYIYLSAEQSISTDILFKHIILFTGKEKEQKVVQLVRSDLGL